MENPLNSLSKIDSSERAPDGNLTAEGRRRALSEIRKFISEMGYLNISELAELLGLSRPTVRSLTNEILGNLRDQEEPQILAQIQWHQDVVATLGRNPAAFTKEERESLKFHSAMLSRITTLQRALRKIKR